MEIKPLDLTLEQHIKDHIEFMDFINKKFQECTISELMIPKHLFN